jgi:hypothetical protein
VARVPVTPETSNLWRVEDFARWARIPVGSVYYQIAKGRIPGVIRLGSTIRIDPQVAISALRNAGPGIDVESARQHLRDTLPADESVEIEDGGLLDAAAAVVVRTKAAP